MALVLEVAETNDGIVVSRGGEECVLRTFGLRGDILLMGLDYGRPRHARLDLELNCWYRFKLYGVDVSIKVERRRRDRLSLFLQADRSLNFKRLAVAERELATAAV